MNEDQAVLYRGWHTTASVALLHACDDTDPQRVLMFCDQAEDAAQRAIEAATNPRQEAATKSLLDAVGTIRELAADPDSM